MSNPQHNSPEVLELIDAAVSGTLTPDQQAKLEAILLDDAQARNLLCEYFTLDAELTSYWEQHSALQRAKQAIADLQATGKPSPETKRSICDQPNRSAFVNVYCFFARPTPLSMTVAAAVMALLIAAMAYMAPPYYRAFTSTDDAQRNEVVAHTTNLHNAQWADGQTGAYLGAGLRRGHELHLLSGKAEITYTNGVRVVLEGPSSFLVTGKLSGTLEAGKLSASVPPEAVGYQVATDVTDIRDLGTQFGMSYDSADDFEVHVIEGRIALEPGKRLATRQIVTAGEAWRWDANSQSLTRTEFDAARFVAYLPPAESQKTATLVAYWDFERDTTGQGGIHDQSSSGADGTLRDNGTQNAGFSDDTPHAGSTRSLSTNDGDGGADVVAISANRLINETFNELDFTIAWWVKVRRDEGVSSSCMFARQGGSDGSRIAVQQAGSFNRFRANMAGVFANDVVNVAPAAPVGWHHVAITVRHVERRVQIATYLDGAEIGSVRTVVDEYPLTGEGDFYFAASAPGGVGTRGYDALWDDFAIWRGALNRREIAELAEGKRPDQVLEESRP